MGKIKRVADKNKKEPPKQPNEEEKNKKRKEKLKNQIESLKDLISNVESTFNLKKFGNTANGIYETKLKEDPDNIKLKNWGYIFHNELSKLAGLYCTKRTSNEYVYCFDVSSSGTKDSVFGVQFFINGHKAQIGKTIMPMLDSINNIISETPIEKSTGVIPFLKNCKRHMNCYASRRTQFEDFKKKASKLKNINIDADIGYNLITIDFFDTFDKRAEVSIDMTAYFLYQNGRARPHVINVKWNQKHKLTEEIIKAMRSFLKPFKNLNLVDALELLVDKNHPIFSWAPIQRENSIINEKDLVNSDEESEESSEPEVKKKRKSRKRKRKASISLEEESKNDSHLTLNEDETQEEETQEAVTQEQETQEPSIKKKKVEKPLPAKQTNQKSKSKQSLLVFNKPLDKTPAVEDKTKPKSPEKTNAVTSTPMPKTIVNNFFQKQIATLEISPIRNENNDEQKKIIKPLPKTKIPGPKSKTQKQTKQITTSKLSVKQKKKMKKK